MADLHVIEQLQTYLVAQGIGQRPSAAVSLTIPSIWKQPRDGAALPRNLAKDASGRWIGETTIALSKTLGRDPSNLEPWMEEAFIDVIVRSPQADTAEAVQRAIKLLIAPWDQLGGRHQWLMGALLVETSDQWRGDQELPKLRAREAADAHATYDRVQSFRIVCRRKILAGLTLP